VDWGYWRAFGGLEGGEDEALMIDGGLVYVQLILGVEEDVCQTICVRFWDVEHPSRYAGRVQ
jgi:hypothetical protein